MENKDNWDEACEMCKMPGMLHKGACTRKEDVNAFEYGKLWEAWELYKKRMMPIRKLQAEQDEKTKIQNGFLMEKFATTLTGTFTASQQQFATTFADSQQKLIEAIQGKENRTAKIVKPARVPAWTKEMTWAVYLKALEAWMEQNKDLSEAVKYQDVMESLKQNKEVNELLEYIGKHIYPALDTVETQTVQQVIVILKRKHGKT